MFDPLIKNVLIYISRNCFKCFCLLWFVTRKWITALSQGNKRFSCMLYFFINSFYSRFLCYPTQDALIILLVPVPFFQWFGSYLVVFFLNTWCWIFWIFCGGVFFSWCCILFFGGVFFHDFKKIISIFMQQLSKRLFLKLFGWLVCSVDWDSD